MTENKITYRQNTSTSLEILSHLEICDIYFVPQLSTTVDLNNYADKLYEKAIRIESWEERNLIALVAFYYNELENFYYISNVSVDPNYKGLGIAKKLLNEIFAKSRENNILKILLEVNKKNTAALQLYAKLGFQKSTDDNLKKSIILEKKLK